MIDLLKLQFDRVNTNIVKGMAVKEQHFKRLITESCKVELEGNQPIVYLNLDEPGFDELWPNLDSLDFSMSTRKTLGKNNWSTLFGATPAVINRSNFCNYGVVIDKDIELHNLLCLKYSTVLNALMKLYLPGWQKVNSGLLDKSNILKDYWMANSIWTSGIINKNSAQNYHYDSMNLPNMMSSMLTLKRNMSGGYLTFPEYEIAFEVANRSVIFFCGRNILHGVSPMKMRNRGRRYSIVYYTTEGLKKCNSIDNEILKATK